MGAGGDYVRRQAELAARYYSNLYYQKSGALRGKSDIFQLSSDYSTATNPKGQVFEAIISGSVDPICSGIYISDSAVFICKDPTKLIRNDAGGKGLFIIRPNLSPAAPWYIRKFEADDLYEIVLPTELDSADNIHIFFSKDGKDIAILGDLGTVVADSVRVYWAIYKNFKLNKDTFTVTSTNIVTGTYDIGSHTPDPSTPSAPPVPSNITNGGGDTFEFELDDDPELPENGGDEESGKTLSINGYVYTKKPINDVQTDIIDVLGNFNNAQIAGTYYRVKTITNGGTTLSFTYGAFSGGERTVTVVQTPPGTSTDYTQLIGNVNWYNNRNSNLGDFNIAVTGISDPGTRITGTRQQTRTVVNPVSVVLDPDDFRLITNLSTANTTTGSLFFDVHLPNDIRMCGFRGTTTAALSESNDPSVLTLRRLRPYNTLIAQVADLAYVYTDTFFDVYTNVPQWVNADYIRPNASKQFIIYQETPTEDSRIKREMIVFSQNDAGDIIRGKSLTKIADDPVLIIQDFILK